MNFWYHLCWWLCRIGLFFWHPVFHVTGREQIPAGSCIFCANHSGMADPIWILLALPEKKMIRIMAKQELRRCDSRLRYLKKMIEKLWADKKLCAEYSANCKNISFDTIDEYYEKIMKVYR